ncbi:FtsX-like permease family protein [Rudanella paleaurantiibacter]|uniref:FtsX-like permease family protein n=1 Tax=Rudanella paleaurantiibacter TaxID=2614655 RepID=A0A7J5U580_9BACT|nr:ABC transporter permease [Rudanella paleaurantiibacter]KAB7732853.1 FtsX-like permease family protein [Rudanella paleaurantiibacter]
MLTNFLKIALRTLWRSRGYAAIHMLGLAVAFCISLFLILIAYQQFTFDSFHADSDRIYQTYLFANDPEKPVRTGAMPMPVVPALKADFPEAEAVTRVMTGRKSLVESGGTYYEKLINYTDADFLNVFSFPLRAGHRASALRDPGSVVISENMAQDVFGTTNPLGKRLRLGQDGQLTDFTVTGVLADAPTNSTIQYDALVRIERSPNYTARLNNWNDGGPMVFVKLPDHVDKAGFEARLKPFTLKYFTDRLDGLIQKKAQPDERGDKLALRLQPLRDVHFNREINDGKGTPIAIVYVLLGLAFFILLIACINFINLSIARSVTRAREVGVRKSLGAPSRSLFAQLWGESALLCGLGFVVGLTLAVILLPTFNATFGARLTLAQAYQPGFIGLILALFLLVTLMAGGYPAWQMTRLQTVQVLKGNLKAGRPSRLRNALLITQFTLSCLLTCCTLIAFEQVDFLRQMPLGFDKEQVISIPVGTQVDGRQVLGRLRQVLAHDPTILSLTGASVNLGKGRDRVTSRSTFGFTSNGKEITSDVLFVDYDYLQTLRIKPTAGRDFSRAFATDSANRVLITESMARQLGKPNPVGMLLGDDADTTGNKAQIIGVVPNFQLYSVADETRPIILYLSNNQPLHYIFVRVLPQHLPGAMDKLKATWATVAPQSPFMGSFLDENVDAWYQNEAVFSQVLSLASGVAVVLSCIGLFAIALLTVEQRTKEIGIRKVMGATVPGIVLLLSRHFIRLVLMGLCLAVPIAWFGMHQWLEKYAYRIEISPWLFVTVGTGALLITLFTVSYQSIRAALMNPAKSLRTE